MIKAIIFDYDGVIADSFVSVFEVYKIICGHFDVACPATLEDFRKTYGYSYKECLKNLGIQEKDFIGAMDIYKKEIIKMKHDIFADIADVVRELGKKYKLYLISASHREEVLPKIERFGLIEYFEEIYCGDDQRIHKSDRIADLLREDKYSPNEVISIGDRVVDYDGSKKAGIADENIILVTYGWGLDKSRVGKANIADSPKDILKFVAGA